jgi:hypothetical protein
MPLEGGVGPFFETRPPSPTPAPSNSGGGKNTYVGGGAIQFTLKNKIEAGLYKNYMVLALSRL